MSGPCYILSIKHSAKHDDYITFWRPNDAGYTCYLPAAGRYTDRQIEASPNYYSNGYTTAAVPCAQVDALGVEAMPGYDCSGPVVQNNAENWATLLDKRVVTALGE